MKRIRSFAAALMILVAPLLAQLLSAASAAPQQNVLTDADIKAFEMKLAYARNIQVGLKTRVTCLEQQDSQMSSQRDAKEKRLGDLRKREGELGSDKEKYQIQYKGYKKSLESEQEKLIVLRRERRELQAKQWAQEQELRECKESWVPNLACNLANEIAYFIGAFKNYDSAIATAEQREKTADEGMKTADEDYQRSVRDLANARSEALTVDAEIARTEADIASLKSALSDLRPNIQSQHLLLDGFVHALESAKRVDTSDGRARTARTVVDLAGKVDGALNDTAELLTQARSVLPAEMVQRCSI